MADQDEGKPVKPDLNPVPNSDAARFWAELRRSNAAGVHTKGKDRSKERRDAIKRSQDHE
jgi:hypothetical protein